MKPAARFASIAFVCAALCTPARAQDDGAGRSAASNEDGVRSGFQEQVRELICADKWDELEDMAAQLRRSRTRWPCSKRPVQLPAGVTPFSRYV